MVLNSEITFGMNSLPLEGITRDTIAAYTPETNGFAESSNRQLLLRANCLLLPTNTASESTLFDFATLYVGIPYK